MVSQSVLPRVHFLVDSLLGEGPSESETVLSKGIPKVRPYGRRTTISEPSVGVEDLRSQSRIVDGSGRHLSRNGVVERGFTGE